MALFLVVLVVTLPALLLLGVGIGLRLSGRALPKPRVVEYLPPKGVPVLDAALLTGNDKRAIPAVLVGLAVSRKIRILAEPDKKAPVAIELQPDAVFTPTELAVLEALFGEGHTSDRVKRFSKDKRQQGRRVSRLLAATEGYLASLGLIGRRMTWPTVMVRLINIVTLLTALFILIGTGVSGDWPAFWLTLASVGVVITTFIVTPTSWRRYAEPSALIREQLAGLNGYITLAEADRLRFLQSPSGALRAASGVTAAGLAVGVPATADPSLAFELDRLILNERLLPYAILFGHSKEWMAELAISYENLSSYNLENIGPVLEIAGDLVLLASAVGNLVELASAVGDAVDAGGAVVDVLGAGAEALSDLFS